MINELIRLENSDNDIFITICEWNYNWWGAVNGKCYEEVEYSLKHSLCSGSRLPQTFVAMADGVPAGMYQLSMRDDLDTRPDIYPWLINVYVDEKFRGHSICRDMMNTVPEKAGEAGLTELYLYTNHIGLYEKFGWQLVEEIPTFKKDTSAQRLYKIEL